MPSGDLPHTRDKPHRTGQQGHTMVKGRFCRVEPVQIQDAAFVTAAAMCAPVAFLLLSLMCPKGSGVSTAITDVPQRPRCHAYS